MHFMKQRNVRFVAIRPIGCSLCESVFLRLLRMLRFRDNQSMSTELITAPVLSSRLFRLPGELEIKRAGVISSSNSEPDCSVYQTLI